MKAITVKQPWALGISHLGKPIENRTWTTKYRGPVAIHAGKGWDKDGEQSHLVQAAWARFAAKLPLLNCHHGPLRKETLWVEFGAVVAVADLIGICSESRAHLGGLTCDCGEWAARGQAHWRLVNVRSLAEPVPCQGALGLWTLPANVEAAVVAQLTDWGSEPMSEPEFPLCVKDDPRIPVFVDMLRKSVFTGGNFTLDARRILAALDAMESDPLHAAIELVLLDHEDELSGERVDANLSELAYCYQQRTGWTVEQEASDG